jgi:glycosyltransferase involved in cell wall biosynthesis
MTHDITVCVASIPPRSKMLRRALATIAVQTLQPVAIIVEIDHERTGAAATKNRALAKVDTTYTAFLDDDDQFLPNHLEVLRLCAEETGADVVYPWPEMVGAGDPRPDRWGVPFDAEELRRGSYIPTTSLVRTKLAQSCGGFQLPNGSIYDDHGLYLAMLDGGAKFEHVAKRTWLWNIHGGNSSGQPERW